jgi:hypothetical protein
MSDTDIKELHRRMVRIETRIVLLIEALGFQKQLPRQSDDESKVVHIINGTKELT